MKKNFVTSVLVTSILSVTVVSAYMPKETARYFNGPTVSSVAATSAAITLSSQLLADLSPEEKAGVYFEYNETNKVCIAIYPTPEACLPKKTKAGGRRQFSLI